MILLTQSLPWVVELLTFFLVIFFSKCNDGNLKSQICQLNNMTIESLNNPSYILIITDASVKNNIATSISHIYIWNKPITKTLHHTVNITSTKAELFAIRCSVNCCSNHLPEWHL